MLAPRALCLVAGLSTAFSLPVRPTLAAVPHAMVADGAGRERKGHVVIDTSALGPSAEPTAAKIEERVGAVFERSAVTKTDAAGDPALHLVVIPLEGDTVGYRISHHVEIGGDTVEGSSGVSDCRLCTEDELADAAEAVLERTVEYMEVDVEPEPPPDSGDEGDDGDDGDTEGPPLVDDGPKARLGGMGKAGIALLAVGGAALVTGIVLVIRKPAPREDKMPTYVFSTRPPGYALLGVGAAVAITGGVLLGLDRRKAKRGSTSRLAPAPWIDPGQGAGLGVVGRF